MDSAEFEQKAGRCRAILRLKILKIFLTMGIKSDTRLDFNLHIFSPYISCKADSRCFLGLSPLSEATFWQYQK
ncbi:MAG: hypothetical protein LKJ45_02905 [Oscillospiraceae bacterium]|jgi:hypothetical protein|nr:hypothetical protein [Oscillospiraceae bacterium]